MYWIQIYDIWPEPPYEIVWRMLHCSARDDVQKLQCADLINLMSVTTYKWFVANQIFDSHAVMLLHWQTYCGFYVTLQVKYPVAISGEINILTGTGYPVHPYFSIYSVNFCVAHLNIQLVLNSS